MYGEAGRVSEQRGLAFRSAELTLGTRAANRHFPPHGERSGQLRVRERIRRAHDVAELVACALQRSEEFTTQISSACCCLEQ